MGHKVHPTGFRLGIIRDWQAKWYADSRYAEFLQEDLKLRKSIRERYPEAYISQVDIDRQAKEVSVTLHTARPGIVIGRGGQRVDEMRLYLERLIGKRVRLNIREIRQPELDAYLVAKTVAEQMERRVAYRRALKQAMFRTLQAGAKGIRVWVAGRLGGAEIARRQIMHEGRVPLHTIRADIDYGFTEAHTTMGRIGVKIWIYKGDVLPERKKPEVEAAPAAAAAATPAPAPAVEAPTPAPAVAVAEKPAAPVAVEPARPAAIEAKPAAPVAEAAPAKAEVKPPVRRRKKPEATAEAEKAPPTPAPEATVTPKPPARRKKKEEKDAAA